MTSAARSPRGDAAPAQPALDPVDVLALQAGVRRAEVRVQLRALAAAPREPEQGRATRGRTGSSAERRPALERHRARPARANAAPSASLHALDRGADDGDLVGGRPGANEAEHLLGDELERAAPTRRPRGNGWSPSSGARAGTSVNSCAFDVRERRREELARARRQLDHSPRQARRVVGGPPERGVRGAAGLVRKRDVHVRPRRQRLEQAPLRAGEVLEPVREDRAPRPCGEIAGQALDRSASERAAIPRVETLELARGTPRQSDASGSPRSSGSSSAPSSSPIARPSCVRVPGSRDVAPAAASTTRRSNDGALGLTDDTLAAAAVAVRERSNRVSNVPIVPASSPPQRSTSSRSTRSTSARFGTIEPGIALERGDEAIEQQLDPSGMRRSDDERESHLCMVVGASAGPLTGAGEVRYERPERGCGRSPVAERTCGLDVRLGARTQARDFGLRPRRATAAPGIVPAHRRTGQPPSRRDARR